MRAKVCEKTIAHGKNRYKVSSDNKWSVLMWGWYPDSKETPSYRWTNILKEQVPKVVKDVV